MPLSVGELLAYLKLDSTGFDAGIAKAREGMASATGSAEKLGGAVGMTETALANAGRSAALASSGTAKFRAAQLSAVAAAERYNAVLADETATVGQLARAEAALIRANQAVKASTPVASIAATGSAATATAAKMTGLRASMGSALGTAKSLGLMFGAFELIKKGIDIGKEAASFQRSMLLIQTNANASATEVKNMTAAVLSLSPQVAASPADLADALYHVEQNGLRGAKALEALKVGAMGAKIGMADVEDTTNTMTIAVASGMHGVNNLQKAMGAMIAVAGTGDMRLSQLNEALGTGILSVAKGFGASMRDVGAVLATLGDNGIRGANAATGLRQVMMGFAKPAAEGADALARVGLTMHSLGDEMTKHGLVSAMNLLNDKMKAAGITGNQVGAFITQAFGRKAGASLGVLIGEMDRVNTKFDEVGKGAASFADKWNATTKTASFAFQKLGAEVEVAGIKIAQKILPAVTSAAQWLGTNLPHAISVLAQILGPTVDLIGNGLGGAWKVVSAALQIAAGVLGSVGHFLEEHKALATGVATAVLGMWAAFKMVTIATAALRLIGPMLIGIGVRARSAGAAIGSSFSMGNAAVAGLAVGVGVLTYVWQQNQAAAAQNKAQINDLTSAIDADSGALGKHTRAAIVDRITQDDLYSTALRAGISQKTLTDAVMGNVGALRQVTAATKAYSKSGDLLGYAKLTAFVNRYRMQLKGAIGDEKNKAAADGKSTAAIGRHADAIQHDNTMLQWNIDAHGRLVQTTVKSGSALDNTTAAMARQTLASGLLKNALDRLNGVNETVEQTTDSFNIAIGNLRSGMSLVKDKNGDVVKSLNQSTVAGATNRQMFVGILDAAKASAQAVADHAHQQGASLPNALAKGNAALGANEAAIRSAAHAIGLNKGQVDGLISDLGHLAKIKAQPKVKLDPAAAITGIQAIENGLARLHDKTIHVTTVSANAAEHAVGRASGGGLPEGVSSVGEQGAELAIKNGSNVQILSNSQSKAYLAATGMKAPGFAGGTGGPITTTQSGGRKVWVYNGIQYASYMAAHNAETRDQQSKTSSYRLSGAPGVGGTSYDTLHAAQAALAKAIKALDHTFNRMSGHDLPELRKALGKTGSDVMSAAKQWIDDAKKLGISSTARHAIADEAQQVARDVNRRNRDQAQLRSLIQNRAAEKQAVAQAGRGGFDITNAGASAAGGAGISGGAINAQAKQANLIVHKWAAGIRKLGGEGFAKSKTGRSMLRQLAEAGPSSWPQVQALLSESPKQLASLIDTERSIDQASASLGGYVGGVDYNPRIKHEREQVRKDQREMRKDWQALRDDMHRFFKRPVEVDVTLDGKKVAQGVATGNNKNARKT